MFCGFNRANKTVVIDRVRNSSTNRASLFRLLYKKTLTGHVVVAYLE
jgi:hypothetical protein